MDIPLTEAKARLTDLVRRAEAGEEVILTRHGQPAARIVAVPRPKPSVEERLALIRRLQVEAARTRLPGPDAAHAADFLYDENGLPG